MHRCTVQSIEDKKLRSTVSKAQRRAQNAALHSAKSELLLTEQAGFLEAEGEMERTFKFSQEELAKHVDLASARKVWLCAAARTRWWWGGKRRRRRMVVSSDLWCDRLSHSALDHGSQAGPVCAVLAELHPQRPV